MPTLALDPLSLTIRLVLLLMSISSWSIIVYKLLQIRQQRLANRQFLENFRQLDNSTGLPDLLSASQVGPLRAIVEQTLSAAKRQLPLQAAQERRETLLTRSIRQALDHQITQDESGMTWLATVSSIAPFVGLLGTVWGVYHALSAIGQSGSATLSTIAGPVGEALIMTGLGLAVALPALTAYNLLTRQYRVRQMQADSFGFELLGLLTKR